MKFVDKIIAEVKQRQRESDKHMNLARMERDAIENRPPVDDERPYWHEPPERAAESYTELGRMRGIAESGLMDKEGNPGTFFSTLFPETKNHTKHIRKKPEKIVRKPQNELWLKEQGDKYAEGGDKIVDIPEIDDDDT